MLQDDFDLRALYKALDERRRERKISWSAVAREISRSGAKRGGVSTITGLRQKRVAEGDGILQMLLWLGRTPESFVPDSVDADSNRFRLPDVTDHQVLRWDTRALFLALNAQRLERQLTWAQVAREVGGFTPRMITGLAKGGRTGFPPVMRLVRWLNRPAASFTRISDW
jgi:hypothetical protein